MTKTTWELYDPVSILPDGGMPAMDGIIAYLDHPKQPQKLGIRLTGSSIGLGDHSGSVDGIDYFDCPLNSGVFVTPDQIEARTLTRIEQLRLKRELAAGQLDSSRMGGMIGGASGFADSTFSLMGSAATNVVRPSMIGSAPPTTTAAANHTRAIAPQERPQSIALNGLSPTALERISQLNPDYMDPNNAHAQTIRVTEETVPEVVEEEDEDDDDEEMLVSSSSSSEEEEEEYLKENRKHISRLQQRKEEIQKRKMELQQKKGGVVTEDEEESPPPPPVVPTTTDKPANGAPQPAVDPATEESRPLSRLEQLKLKKRQMELAPTTTTTTTTAASSTSTTTATSTQPSTVTNVVSMAAAASPGRSAAAAAAAAAQASPPAEGEGEQVPWPFPATTREVSITSSLTSGSENNNNTAAAAVAPGTATVVSQSPAVAVPAPAPAAEPTLSRLEQLKLKKRQLELGGPTPVATGAAAPTPTKAQASPVPPTTPPAQPSLEAQSMDRGVPVNGNGQQPQPPSEVTVQIMNSSTKRVKELQLPISKETNLFAFVYDNKTVKQANVRKWGTSFVQQVREKKSEIRCRVSVLSNPPINGENTTTKPEILDLSVSDLHKTTTDQLYNLYKDFFYPQRSKIQVLLVCQPIPTDGDDDEENDAAKSNKLVSEPETTTTIPIVSVTPAALGAQQQHQPETKKDEQENQEPVPPQVPIDRSSITSIASTLKDINHQLRIKIINERTRYFKDLLVETSQKINLYEAIYNNPAVKEAKVRKWNSSIVEQVRSGMAEIVCQICTIPNGKPEHLVKHGILTIDQLKECSTTQLYTRYAMDHYDLDNDESLIQLVLKCQQVKTPVASNQASSRVQQDQSKLATPTRLTDSLPPSAAQEDASRGNPILETPPVPTRPIQPRGSPSSFSSMEKKPTNSPYAQAASAALPIHTTNTKFSDLYPQPEEPQRQQQHRPPTQVTAAVHPDPELGQAGTFRPIPTHPKTDAAVQTSVQITTPVRDNRQTHFQHNSHSQQPLTLADKLQQVDAMWWIAIIFILAAAFFAALFLGPVS